MIIDEDKMLPFSYNTNDIELLPIEPHTLFSYWDYSCETWEELQQNKTKHLILILLSNSNERHFIINLDTKSYYFRGIRSNQDYQIQLARPTSNGFRMILESKTVTTPAKWPSENRTVVSTKFKFPKPPEQPGKPLYGWSAPIKNFEQWLTEISGKSGKQLKGSEFYFNSSPSEQSLPNEQVSTNDLLTNEQPSQTEYKSHFSYKEIDNPSSGTLIKNKQGGENA